MTFITKKKMARRTMLKGLGASLALPMLDSMMPALSAATTPTTRLGWVYASHGVIWSQWKPTQLGYGFELTPNLKPLEKLNGQFNILTGLSHLEADTKGDGSGDHTRASAAWLTGVHAYDRTRPGVEVKLATTADQLAAQVLGRNSQIPSIEMTVDTASAGSCDSGDCFYVNTVSWRNPTTPNLPENQPRVIFERLFGDGGSAAQRAARTKKAGSILDSVMEEASGLASTLGNSDRSKLGEYLDSVRDLEQRIQGTESKTAENFELPDRPVGIPDSFEEHTKLMFDLQIMAYRADLTRVFSMILARELSGRTYPMIGIPGQHHLISHHRDDAELMSQKARIDTYHVQMLGYLLEKMAATPDGDGSLLDHSLIMYGSGMGNGNLHRHSDMPVLLAGKLAGKFKTGYHLDYKMDTPMANLLVAILDKAGVPIEKMGDSTGPLKMEAIAV
ncbi:MAG TPA: DUF1552 domain-containing protein [Bryobacteraceae bacterium]|jgi:hypothetical protein|nr:DUF1552 domain-containing protein [Bryobacteraceae bacterium]